MESELAEARSSSAKGKEVDRSVRSSGSGAKRRVCDLCVKNGNTCVWPAPGANWGGQKKKICGMCEAKKRKCTIDGAPASGRKPRGKAAEEGEAPAVPVPPPSVVDLTNDDQEEGSSSRKRKPETVSADSNEEEQPRKRVRTRGNPAGLTPFERQIVSGFQDVTRAVQGVEVQLATATDVFQQLAEGMLMSVRVMVRELTARIAEAEGSQAGTEPPTSRATSPTGSEGPQGGERIPVNPPSSAPGPTNEGQAGSVEKEEDVEMAGAESPETPKAAASAEAEAGDEERSSDDDGSYESDES